MFLTHKLLEEFEHPVTLLRIRIIPFTHGPFFEVSLGLQNEPLQSSIEQS